MINHFTAGPEESGLLLIVPYTLYRRYRYRGAGKPTAHDLDHVIMCVAYGERCSYQYSYAVNMIDVFVNDDMIMYHMM